MRKYAVCYKMRDKSSDEWLDGLRVVEAETDGKAVKLVEKQVKSEGFKFVSMTGVEPAFED